MKQCFAFVLLLFSAFTSLAQLPFKYDSLYKKIYARDICNLLQKQKDVVFIDVRTPGEFADTSRFPNLNQGHLKGVVNIDIEKIKKDSSLLDGYKDKTVVLYCSHSQRSRKVSKLLTERGFSNFYNLNGGMSTLNELTEAEFPCKKEWLVSVLPYKNLSVQEAIRLLQNEKKLFIIDMRSAEQFNSRDTSLPSNVGRIKRAVHIPYANFKQTWNELEKHKQEPVLIYGESGYGNSAKFASELVTLGFTNVNHLLGGINEFIAEGETSVFIDNPAPYRIVDATHALKLLQEKKGLIVYDTREMDEYNNRVTGKMAYRNLGRIRNAIHMEDKDFGTQSLPGDKNADLLIYGNESAFKFALLLKNSGYKNVYVLDSFYSFVWSGFNIEHCKEAKTFLVNHQDLY